MGKNYHLALDIAGCLKRHEKKSLAGLFEDDGVELTDIEVRRHLSRCLNKGWKLIPMCDENDCLEFDHFGKGCPGHEIKDEKQTKQ